MSIYASKHKKFRNAVIQSMRDIAMISDAYDDKDKRTEYIETAVDVAFNTILNCFDDEYYSSLNDTMCRRYAKSDIYDAIDNDSIDSIDAESVFEDIDEMQDDEDEDDDCE